MDFFGSGEADVDLIVVMTLTGSNEEMEQWLNFQQDIC
jgi:hypothetical protein